MIKVYQDIFGEKGNCLAACTASILELKLSDVPNFAAMRNRSEGTGDWFGPWWKFMVKHGFEITPFHQPALLKWPEMPKHLENHYCYYIGSGPAARGFSHATVWWQGKMMHDPHPSEAGLLHMQECYFFKPISRARLEEIESLEAKTADPSEVK